MILEVPCLPPTEWVPVTKSTVRVGNNIYHLPTSTSLRMLTVGTDPTDGYYRYIQSAKTWDYRVLGFGDKWDGWKKQALTGGGKKILYLKDYFDTHVLPEYIVFTDCYDVVVVSDADEVMRKYKQHFDGKLVFGAEVYCWPDEDMATKYPNTSSSKFKYLNSGLFMGPSKLIHKYLTNTIASSDDDQRYFTNMFLAHPDDIVLDYDGILFQNLAGTSPQEFQTNNGRVVNPYNHQPCFLHGNGPGRKTLDALTTRNDCTIHLINLETNPEKREACTNNFKQLGLRYAVMQAIDGAKYTLSPHERWLFKQVNYDIDVKVGVVGCSLSHLQLLETFVRSNQSYLLVAEDNITIVEPDIANVVRGMVATPFSMINLCCLKQPPVSAKVREVGTYALYRCKNQWYGQGARFYIVSKSCAISMLQKYYRGEMCHAIDWFYMTEVEEPLVAYPSLCRFDGENFYSSHSAIEERGGH